MSDKDFEVLPVGSTKELIFVRKFAADIIMLNKTMTLPIEAATLIKNVEQSYKELLDDEFNLDL